jgi:hypothetical protein
VAAPATGIGRLVTTSLDDSLKELVEEDCVGHGSGLIGRSMCHLSGPVQERSVPMSAADSVSLDKERDAPLPRWNWS